MPDSIVLDCALWKISDGWCISRCGMCRRGARYIQSVILRDISSAGADCRWLSAFYRRLMTMCIPGYAVSREAARLPAEQNIAFIRGLAIMRVD